MTQIPGAGAVDMAKLQQARAQQQAMLNSMMIDLAKQLFVAHRGNGVERDEALRLAVEDCDAFAKQFLNIERKPE